jgi:PAS domain S-box-containing protein
MLKHPIEKVRGSIYYKILLSLLLIALILMGFMSLVVIQSTEIQREAISQDMEELANITREITDEAKENQLISTYFMVTKTQDSLAKAHTHSSNHTEFMWYLYEEGQIGEESLERSKEDHDRFLGSLETINYTVVQSQRELGEGLDLTTRLVDANLKDAITLQEEKLDSTIRQTSLIFVALFFFGVVLVVSVSYLATRKIIGPVEELQAGFREFSKGNLNFRIKPSSADELGALSEEFNRMVGDHKEAIRALAESEEKYRGLVEHTTDAIIGLDLDRHIMSWNKGARQMLGYTRDEVLDRSQDFVVPEESREACNLNVKEATMSGHVRGVETVRRAKDGRDIPVEMSLTALTDKEGDHIGFVTILRDITGRKEAEETLRESERRFREMTDLLPETIFEIDLEGNLQYVNKTALSVFGYTKEDVRKGLNAFALFVPEDLSRIKESIQRLLDGDAPQGNDYTALKKDGSQFPVVIYSSPIFQDQRPVGMRGFIIDITDRKKAENELKERMDELEQWNRLTVGREKRMIELKREVNDLREELERDKKYDW